MLRLQWSLRGGMNSPLSPQFWHLDQSGSDLRSSDDPCIMDPLKKLFLLPLNWTFPERPIANHNSFPPTQSSNDELNAMLKRRQKPNLAKTKIQKLQKLLSTFLFFCNSSQKYRIVSEKKGWVDSIPVPLFSKKANSKNFVGIVPIRDGRNGFFDHLIFVDTVYKRSHPITHGSSDVIQLHAWDETDKFV